MTWLKKAYNPNNILFVDFDRTILDNDGVFGEKMIPFPGAKEALEQLRDSGYKICIYSCRSNNGDRKTDMINILAEYSIPYDEIVDGKPEFTFLIDDRVIESHSGDWEYILSRIPEIKGAKKQGSLGKREKEVLEVFSDGERHSVSDISQQAGISEHWVDYDISVLLQFELLDWDGDRQTAGLTDLGRKYLESQR
jgi:hypothetical protein